MDYHFDIVVVGTGPAASRVVALCASERSVAVVEARELGGTCALRGCNPKKALVRTAELYDWMNRAPYCPTNDAILSWPDIMAFKDRFVDPVPERTRASTEDRGVACFQGAAHFIDEQSTCVNGDTLRADNVVVATGATPAPITVPGYEHIALSDEFLSFATLPQRILFVGGGFVSFEFAHVAARAGAHCTIIDRHPRPLKRFDPMLTETLSAHTEAMGIDMLRNTSLGFVTPDGRGAYTVGLLPREGVPRTITVDRIVHGAGRVPQVDGLNLEAAGVQVGKRGVRVNEHLQTDNPRIYAAGDVADTGQPMLSPVANQEGRIVAKNLLEGPHRTADYGPVPTVVYTIPGLASVGLTEAQAREKGLDVDIREGDRAGWGSMRKASAPCAAYRILVHADTDEIVGAHLLGPDAAETINHFAMAMKFGLTARDIKSVLFAFPSFAADVRQML